MLCRYLYVVCGLGLPISTLGEGIPGPHRHQSKCQNSFVLHTTIIAVVAPEAQLGTGSGFGVVLALVEVECQRRREEWSPIA